MLAALAAAAALAAPHLHLKPCTLQGSVAASCGVLQVPEDRRKPAGRRIGLFVGVVRAYGTGRRTGPPIFYLAGGPGAAAASETARFASTVFFGANVRRDLVLVDQRGVGRSAPLYCKVPAGAGPEDVVPTARRCVADAPRDAGLYTTDAAMDDLDAVRAALGYSKIVLYGGSYGAAAAQVYLARHGRHVAAAVLDGATALNIPIWERMAPNVQRAFDRLVARCRADAACHRAFPSPARDLAAVEKRLRKGPITTAELGSMLRALLRAPETSAAVPLLLHRAAQGELGPLVTAGKQATAGESGLARRLMYWGIVCSEGWARNRGPVAARLARGTFYADAATAFSLWYASICPTFGKPLPAPDTGVVPKSTVPVLFLVGGMDPQDPLENLAGVRRKLTRAAILVVPGAGHGSVQYGCVPQVAARFFASGRLSRADRACAAAVRPPRFLLP